jgi:hypothetical protein
MANPFSAHGRSTTGPSVGPFAVTPSDSTDLGIRSVYVGVTGNVAVRSADTGVAVTFVAVPAGATIPAGFYDRVLATGTTATSLVGLP